MKDYILDCLDSDEDKLLNVFYIFDGYGGIEVPKYLSAYFYEYLTKNENFKNGKYKEAFKKLFLK